MNLETVQSLPFSVKSIVHWCIYVHMTCMTSILNRTAENNKDLSIYITVSINRNLLPIQLEIPISNNQDVEIPPLSSPRRWLECIYRWIEEFDCTIKMLQYLPWVLGRDASEGEVREILVIIISIKLQDNVLSALQVNNIPVGIFADRRWFNLLAPRPVVEISRASRVLGK